MISPQSIHYGLQTSLSSGFVIVFSVVFWRHLVGKVSFLQTPLQEAFFCTWKRESCSSCIDFDVYEYALIGSIILLANRRTGETRLKTSNLIYPFGIVTLMFVVESLVNAKIT